MVKVYLSLKVSGKGSFFHLKIVYFHLAEPKTGSAIGNQLIFFFLVIRWSHYLVNIFLSLLSHPLPLPLPTRRQSYPQDGKTDGTETTANVHQKLFYHVLGTKQAEDILCGEFPDNPKWMDR